MLTIYYKCCLSISTLYYNFSKPRGTPDTRLAGDDAHYSSGKRTHWPVVNQVSTNDRHVLRGQDMHSVNTGVPLWTCVQAPSCHSSHIRRPATILEGDRDHSGLATDRAGCILDHHANDHADDLISIQVLHLPDTEALF